MFVHYNQLIREKKGLFSSDGLKYRFLEPETYIASSISEIDTEQMKATRFKFRRGFKGRSLIILPSCQYRAYQYAGKQITLAEFRETLDERDPAKLGSNLKLAMRLITKSMETAELYDMTGAIQVRSGFKGGDGSRIWYPIIEYHHYGDSFRLDAIYKPEEPMVSTLDALLQGA